MSDGLLRELLDVPNAGLGVGESDRQGGALQLGFVVGPSLGGIMTDSLGWRSVFYVNLPVGILAIVVLIFTLPANLSPRVQNARIDWAGAATITLAISALLLAVEWGGSEFAWASPTIIGLLGFSLRC